MCSARILRQGLTHVTTMDSEWTVEAVKQVSYHVIASRDLFDLGNTSLLEGEGAAMQHGARRLVIIDATVDRLHGERVRTWFAEHGVRTVFVTMRADESVKEWASVSRVVDAMNEFGIDRRREPMIAIGGGVLLDVVGFAASLYRRGTPYVRIPTTLIGLVDAGVGVKTGVNYGSGKNRIGTYAPAISTFLDRRFLSTVPARHLSNGMAEILKMALIRSRELFDLLDEHGRELIGDRLQGSTPKLESAARDVMSEAIHLMLAELQPNLWESCLERCVDYGHTFSPTLEMHALPGLLHGEAVGIDMALTSVMGYHRGQLSEDHLHRILSVMRRMGLPIWTEVLATPGLLDAALADTVRHRDGEQRLPLPVGIGDHRFVNDVTTDEIAAALDWLQADDRAVLGEVPLVAGAAE